ncbi:hypothetical protein M501DRAFT_706827 [Patellaria atrata CBS 101060]|uniref:Uncharacterized protein n=1 Tax=Patellaria atrata CBS 101060 TaxID=1346257 RepID=A0A9P4SEP9_9PEZI|nr:hypothetical protein M501DRAFT_706827 [Patellaria atrata CBS 101060]
MALTGTVQYAGPCLALRLYYFVAGPKPVQSLSQKSLRKVIEVSTVESVERGKETNEYPRSHLISDSITVSSTVIRRLDGISARLGSARDYSNRPITTAAAIASSFIWDHAFLKVLIMGSSCTQKQRLRGTFSACKHRDFSLRKQKMELMSNGGCRRSKSAILSKVILYRYQTRTKYSRLQS